MKFTRALSYRQQEENMPSFLHCFFLKRNSLQVTIGARDVPSALHSYEYNVQRWARLKAESNNSIQVSHISNRAQTFGTLSNAFSSHRHIIMKPVASRSAATPTTTLIWDPIAASSSLIHWAITVSNMAPLWWNQRLLIIDNSPKYQFNSQLNFFPHA